MSESFAQLLYDVRACSLCKADLVAGVRPVLQINPDAKILIAGQAPGSKVHATGVPFDDASGDRLRYWMGIDRDTFYNESKIAILPMSFCYPGKGRSGDLPPMPICAKTWRKRLLLMMPNIRLTLVIGKYAQAWHLDHLQNNLTETVREWRSYGELMMPLPHPSPRNNIWLKKNAWFETEVLPCLKKRVGRILS
jgi:uracil-DNA glycosylase family 4